MPACGVAQNHANRDFDALDDFEAPHTLLIRQGVEHRPKHDEPVVPSLDQLAREWVPEQTNTQSGQPTAHSPQPTQTHSDTSKLRVFG